MMESLQQRLQQASVQISGQEFNIPTLKTVYIYSALAVMFALVLLDLLTAHVAQLGLAGVVLWYVSYLYIAIFAALCFRDLFTPVWPLKAPITTIFIVAYLAMIAWNLNTLHGVSGEAAQEMSCTLTQLTHAVDHGYQDNCLLGYPARQFFLSAVPSLLFGRSLVDLHLGGGLYFILGLLIFSTGALKRLQYGLSADLLTAVLLASLVHIHFFDVFSLPFEQSLYPLCFGLIIAGLFLHYRTQHDEVPIVLAGFVLLYLVHSYTPSLAIYALALLVFAYLALTRQSPARDTLLFALISMLSLASLRLSLAYRQDIHGADTSSRSASALFQDVLAAFDHIAFLNHGAPMLSPVFTFVFLFFMVASLLFVFGREAALIALWAVAVIIVAEVARGFAYYGIDFRLHRSMIIFPILFALAVTILRRFDVQHKERYIAIVLLILSVTGLKFYVDYWNSATVNAHVAFIQWMQSHVAMARTAGPNESVYFFPGPYYAEFSSLNDEMEYFIPRLQGSELPQAGSGQNCAIGGGLTGIFVVPTSDTCFHTVQGQVNSGTNLTDDGIYTDAQGSTFAVYERS
jgi:hypothetical protein